MTNKWERPKLTIPKTKSEWILDIIGYGMYVFTIILLFVVWTDLPQEVPGHYNVFGEVDRWGTKWELLILPFIGAMMLFSLQILEKFPEIHNYPERFNISNAKQFYLQSRKLINQLKNICILIFTVIQLESISIAMEWSNGFGSLFLPVILCSVFLPIVIALFQFKKIK